MNPLDAAADLNKEEDQNEMKVTPKHHGPLESVSLDWYHMLKN